MWSAFQTSVLDELWSVLQPLQKEAEWNALNVDVNLELKVLALCDRQVIELCTKCMHH